MPSWVVLVFKIIVLLVTHFAVYEATEIRNRPFREAIERLKKHREAEIKSDAKADVSCEPLTEPVDIAEWYERERATASPAGIQSGDVKPDNP
jgi:hypothetical protein